MSDEVNPTKEHLEDERSTKRCMGSMRGKNKGENVKLRRREQKPGVRKIT